nr:ABC transporter permease [Akkermansiaceae bacterium]
FTLGNEGLTLAILPSHLVLLKGLLVALLLGLLASLYPAWRASRQPVIESLNAA